MIRTVVCEKEGCRGNSFFISNENEGLELICSECGEGYNMPINTDYRILSSCTECSRDIFKIFKDGEKGTLYAKCTECGGPPHKVYVDESGVQVSYEQKRIEELKDMINNISQRLESLEDKADLLGADQQVMQQSLGYIADFIQKNP